MGHASINKAEFTVLLMVLKLMSFHGYLKLQVFGDSLNVIEWLANQIPPKNIYLLPIYEETRRIIDQFQGVSLRHIYREQNKLVDILSKQGLLL